MSAPHLPLHVLKALMVRTGVALALDARDWPTQITAPEYEDCEHARNTLLLSADRADSKPENNEPPADFFDKVIYELAQLRGEIKTDEVLRRLDVFEQQLPKEHSDHTIVSVQQVLDLVKQGVYQWVGDAHGDLPASALEIRHVHVDANATEGLLSKSCVSAQHSVADSDAALASEVTIMFKQKAFCWEALCQLPYVLTHEMVCHVFQGVAEAGQRKNASRCCAWSEGWMDALAYGIYCRLHAREATLPAWWTNEVERVLEHGETYHERRYKTGAAGLMPFQIKGRKQARARLKRFFSALSLALDSKDAGWEAATRISVRLNAENLGRRRWGQLLNDLRILLEQPGSAKHSHLIRNSLEFIENKLSTSEYLDSITALAEG